MNDPRIVANYLLDVAAKKGIPITNLALQKLLYFAHAISLVERKTALVSGYFEAWQYGPVHPAVFQAFKSAGSRPIDFRTESFDPVIRVKKSLPTLNEKEACEICERVMIQFGRMSAGRLVDITHARGGPWEYIVSKAENGANIGLRIPNHIIAERHGRQKVTVTPVPRVGEPDEDSPLV